MPTEDDYTIKVDASGALSFYVEDYRGNLCSTVHVFQPMMMKKIKVIKKSMQRNSVTTNLRTHKILTVNNNFLRHNNSKRVVN